MFIFYLLLFILLLLFSLLLLFNLLAVLFLMVYTGLTIYLFIVLIELDRNIHFIIDIGLVNTRFLMFYFYRTIVMLVTTRLLVLFIFVLLIWIRLLFILNRPFQIYVFLTFDDFQQPELRLGKSLTLVLVLVLVLNMLRNHIEQITSLELDSSLVLVNVLLV